MLGYTEDQIYTMIASINIANDILDGPLEIEQGLYMASDFLQGLLSEGHLTS